MKVDHIGVPVKSPQKGEEYVPKMKLHLTRPEHSPYLFECLRFDADSLQPEELKTMIHVAYECDNLEKIVADADKVLIPPFQRMPGLRLVFLHHEKRCAYEAHGIQIK